MSEKLTEPALGGVVVLEDARERAVAKALRQGGAQGVPGARVVGQP